MSNGKIRWLPDSPPGCLLAFALTLSSATATAAGPNGVRLDGSLGGSASTLTGPVFNISQGLGKLSGGNLFFSFQYFNIGTGQTALFSTTSSGIENVISRVTGPYASSIDGTIQLNAASGAPNFFLINPAGVTFTANASINVPAAFYVTTANYLKFGDGNFYADPAKASTLSTAAPEAFGFLGTTRAAPVNVTGATLAAGPSGNGQADFQIVAGDVTIDGQGNSAGITNTTGDVRVIAIGSQAIEVPLAGPFASSDGTVSFLNGGSVQTADIASAPAGSISLSAGTLSIQGYSGSNPTGLSTSDGAIDVTVGTLSIDSTGATSSDQLTGIGAEIANTPGAAISVNVAGAASITNGGSIQSGTSGTGSAGNLIITAGSLAIDSSKSPLGAGIFSYTEPGSSGSSGRVAVTTQGATSLSAGGVIGTFSDGSGNAGDITLSAASLNITGVATLQTGIVSDSDNGTSGAVSINTADAITLSSGGTIESVSYGTAAGNLSLVAGSLSVDGSSSVVYDSGSGAGAGTVSVMTVGPITLTNGGGIRTYSFIDQGGPVGQALAAGNPGDITLTAASLTVADPGSGIAISSSGSVNGHASNISITTTGATTLTNGATIESATSDLSNGGNITIAASSFSADGGGSGTFTGIQNAVNGGSIAGAVSVTTTGATTLTSGGAIETYTMDTGKAADVTLDAASLTIDGGPSDFNTGILTSTGQGSSGNSGLLTLTIAGSTTLLDGGRIESNTQGLGSAGDITLSTGSLSIVGTGSNMLNSAIDSLSRDSVSGSSGNVSITSTGAIALSAGALIESTSMGVGIAGTVSVNAAAMSADGGRSNAITGILTGDTTDAGSDSNSGAVSVVTTGATTLTRGGLIQTTALGPGSAGDITVTAGSLTINGGTSGSTGIFSTAACQSSCNTSSMNGSSGLISVTTAGATMILSGGQIDSTSTGSASSGGINLTAQSLNIDGTGAVKETGIMSSNTFDSTGNAGQVTIVAPVAITLSAGGEIESDARSAGNAGVVAVTTGSLSIQGAGSAGTFLNEFTGISSSAELGSSGNANLVYITATGAISLTNSGQISSFTKGSGSANDVTISAASLSIVGNGTQLLTGITSAAYGGSSGSAGQVSVNTTGATALSNGGQILSDTFASGPAGSVTVNSGPMTIEGGSSAASTGLLSVADKGSSGKAGSVIVTASSLVIDGGSTSALTGISSSAAAGSSGNAGDVDVTTTGSTTISNRGQILSATFASGNAGSLSLTAGSLTIDGGSAPEHTGLFVGAHSASTGSGGAATINVTGVARLVDGGEISSQAEQDSNGQQGNITLNAGTLVLGSGAQITIENDATVAAPTLIKPTLIDIHAGSIQMNGGAITAESTGNIAASSIDITAEGLLWLAQSKITTSVTDTAQGNGGNITITTPAIIFDTSAIQANTSAPQALGGDITIIAPILIPSFQSFIRGGALVGFEEDVAGLNVVQAAAPEGVSGTLTLTLPDLNVQNSLARLAGTPAAPIALGRDPCRYRPGSSLLLVGRGGLPAASDAPLWADADEIGDAPGSKLSTDIRAEWSDRFSALAADTCR